MIKKNNKIIISYYLFLFFVSFLLNFLWEISHSGLYIWTGLMEKSILHFAWFSAKDAIFYLLFILLIAVVSGFLLWFRKPKLWHYLLLIIFGLIFSFGIEYHAINSGRWAYGLFMPIIPILNVGLSPILQMSIGPLLAIIITNKICRNILKYKVD